MSEIVLSEFNLRSISIDQIDQNQIWLRLVLLNTKPGRASTYLVLAFPENAKDKSSDHVVLTWPEVVLGLITETHGDGNQTDGTEKSWNLHPTMKNGNGWRKKPVMLVRGRSYAAICLLGWWAGQNEKRS
jgi:hypothetical protein